MLSPRLHLPIAFSVFITVLLAAPPCASAADSPASLVTFRGQPISQDTWEAAALDHWKLRRTSYDEPSASVLVTETEDILRSMAIEWGSNQELMDPPAWIAGREAMLQRLQLNEIRRSRLQETGDPIAPITQADVDAAWAEGLKSGRYGDEVVFDFLMMPADDGNRALLETVREGNVADHVAARKLMLDFAKEHTSARSERSAGVRARQLLPAIRVPLFEELEVGQMSEVIELGEQLILVRLMQRTKQGESPSDPQRAVISSELARQAALRRIALETDKRLESEPAEPGDIPALLPGTPEEESTVVLSCAGGTLTRQELREWLYHNSLWPHSSESWAVIAHRARRFLAEESYLASVGGEPEPESWKRLRRSYRMFWAAQVSALKETPLTDEDMDRAYALLLGRERSNGPVTADILYLRPGQRVGEERSFVPQEEILKDAEALLARINGGLDFGEAVATYSTDEASRAHGGRATLGEPHLIPSDNDSTLLTALRNLGSLGEIAGPVRLSNGFALARLVQRGDLNFPPLDAIRPLVVHTAERSAGESAAGGWRRRVQQEDLVIDPAALTAWAEEIIAREAAAAAAPAAP